MVPWTALTTVGEMHNASVFKAKRDLINCDKSNIRIPHSHLEKAVYIHINTEKKMPMVCC